MVTVSGSVALIPRHGQRNRPWSALSRSWRLVTWYVKEVVGENDYEHFVEHLRHHHPHARPASRKVFERDKVQRLEAGPNSRCRSSNSRRALLRSSVSGRTRLVIRRGPGGALPAPGSDDGG
ncbi:CstA-like transporter-associated (seleno)protein, partial [Micromonospora sp. DT47]|uniref:CstA-like transporter-associated (seleno)protein n=1 Tax=Micromonospora sp. DT47 TaxID=3393431 RepID=UPI003CF6E4BA